LRWLDAPRALFALLAAMVAGLSVALAITSFWKISIHAAVAAGTVASLAILVSPWWLLLVPFVVLTGWARVEIRDHTPVQVSVGAIVGAGVAAGVLLLVA
jgi:membrane-associated phospholipid phosphatase